MQNDRPINDLKLRKAMNAIAAIIAKYDFAGAVMVISPDEAAFMYAMFASWSAIREDQASPMGWRLRAKSAEDGVEVTKARVEGALHTVCMLSDFGSQTMGWMEQIKAMMRQNGLDFEHRPFNGRPPDSLTFTKPGG